MNRNADTTHLYEVLGIERDADDAAINRAYKKLALKYHPDKNRGNKEAEAKFLEVKQAKEVLSNPSKRKIYDEFGLEGISFFERYIGEEHADEVLFVLQLLYSPLFPPFMCCFTLVIITFAFLFPIFVGANINNPGSYSWGVAFLPIWVVFACTCLYFGVAASTGKPSPSCVLAGTNVILLFVFALLLCIRLGAKSGSWFIPFIPYWAFEGIGLLTSLPKLSPGAYKHAKDEYLRRSQGLDMEDEDEEAQLPSRPNDLGLGWLGFVFTTLFRRVSFTVATILLASQLDNPGNSWFNALSVFFVYFAVEGYIMKPLEFRVSMRDEVDQIMRGMSTGATVDEVAEAVNQAKFNYTTGVCGYGCYRTGCIVFVLLVGLKANGAAFSAYTMFVPVFIHLTILGCGLCCLTCVLLMQLNSSFDEFEDMERGGGGGPVYHNYESDDGGAGEPASANAGNSGTEKLPLSGGPEGENYGAVGEGGAGDRSSVSSSGYHGGGAAGGMNDID